MSTKFKPEAKAVKPASAPRFVALVPGGGAAGITRDAKEFPQTAAGTTRIAMMTTDRRMNTTMNQFTISRVREIFRPNKVMPNTRNRSPTPSSFTVVISAAVLARPKRSGKRLSPAAWAQPPQMNPRQQSNAERGVQSQDPGGTRPNATT